MDNYKKISLFICAILTQLLASAQAITSADNVGFMRSEAKINVVMAVVLTILAGLIIYIIRLDRKISKLEKGDNV